MGASWRPWAAFAMILVASAMQNALAADDTLPEESSALLKRIKAMQLQNGLGETGISGGLIKVIGALVAEEVTAQCKKPSSVPDVAADKSSANNIYLLMKMGKR